MAVGGGRWDAAGAEGALDSLSCSNTWTLTAVCFKAGVSQARGTHSEQHKAYPEPRKQKRDQKCGWEDVSDGAKPARGQEAKRIWPIVLCNVRLLAQLSESLTYSFDTYLRAV